MPWKAPVYCPRCGEGCRFFIRHKNTETMEYEIELNGREHTRYVLAWADIWREGTVELRRSGSCHFGSERPRSLR